MSITWINRYKNESSKLVFIRKGHSQTYSAHLMHVLSEVAPVDSLNFPAAQLLDERSDWESEGRCLC